MGLGCDQVATLPNCEAYHFPFHTRMMLSTKQSNAHAYHFTIFKPTKQKVIKLRVISKFYKLIKFSKIK